MNIEKVNKMNELMVYGILGGSTIVGFVVGMTNGFSNGVINLVAFVVSPILIVFYKYLDMLKEKEERG